MSYCKHQNLVLIVPQDKKLRCRCCHLTIDEKEVADKYCPECYETHGLKRFDFDRLEIEDDGRASYKCEKCGLMITCHF